MLPQPFWFAEATLTKRFVETIVNFSISLPPSIVALELMAAEGGFCRTRHLAIRLAIASEISLIILPLPYLRKFREILSEKQKFRSYQSGKNGFQ